MGESERIYSLKREDIEKEQCNYYGISHLVAGIKLTINENDSVNEQYKKLKSALKRRLKANFEKLGCDDKIKFLNDISSLGDEKIKLKFIETFNNETETTVRDILCSAAKIKKNDEIVKYFPAEVSINQTNKVITAYTLANHDLPEKYHCAKYGLKRNANRIGHFWFVDLYRIMTDIFINNSLNQFVLHHCEYIQYKITEYYSQKSLKLNKAVLPDNADFSLHLRKSMSKYNLSFIDGNDGEKVIDDTYSFEDFMVLEKNGKQSILQNHNGLDIVIPRFIRTITHVTMKVERIIDERSDYARVFQDKKYVNKRTQSIMKNNKFLSRYGKVELDNDVDLLQFKALEKEFYELKDMLYIPLAKDYSFRIRKLGRHRAAGIHFPTYKTTAIDISHPDSFLHELGHQIDYNTLPGKIMSDELEFLKIIQLYEEEVYKNIHALPSDDPFLKIWYGKTKYNRDYFLQCTEIFARSYELYVFHIKKIVCSFLKEEYNSPVYPNNPVFLNQIGRYFDNLFSSLSETAPENNTDKFPASSPLVVRHYEHSPENLLLLF